jgi:hypothetical protein
MACAMARIRNAASVVEGRSIGCAALSPFLARPVLAAISRPGKHLLAEDGGQLP